MKTTFDLSEPLFRAAKKAASQHKTTLRALVEEGLRLALERRAQSAERAYVLPDCRATAGAQVLIPSSQQWQQIENEWLMLSMKLDQHTAQR